MLLVKLNFFAMMLLQGSEVNFDLRSMWANMGTAARGVVVLLAIMSAWSIGVMIDRYIAFSQARKQSREFAPAVAGCLKEGKIEEAIQFYEQAIKFDVNCALAYANMGFALRNKRDRKKALKAFEDAVAAYDRLIYDEEKAFLYYYKIQALRQLGPNREDDVRIAKENARRLGFIINS